MILYMKIGENSSMTETNYYEKANLYLFLTFLPWLNGNIKKRLLQGYSIS